MALTNKQFIRLQKLLKRDLADPSTLQALNECQIDGLGMPFLLADCLGALAKNSPEESSFLLPKIIKLFALSEAFHSAVLASSPEQILQWHNEVLSNAVAILDDTIEVFRVAAQEMPALSSYVRDMSSFRRAIEIALATDKDKGAARPAK